MVYETIALPTELHWHTMPDAFWKAAKEDLREIKLSSLVHRSKALLFSPESPMDRIQGKIQPTLG